MIKKFKINTSILICTAFVFRLLFVNIGIISSSKSFQNNSFIKTHISTIMKRRRNVDASNNSVAKEYSVIEICEENFKDEDELSKTNPFILIRLLYSFLTNKVTLKSNTFFDSLHYKLSSKKYLAISVLRI